MWLDRVLFSHSSVDRYLKNRKDLQVRCYTLCYSCYFLFLVNIPCALQLTGLQWTSTVKTYVSWLDIDRQHHWAEMLSLVHRDKYPWSGPPGPRASSSAPLTVRTTRSFAYSGNLTLLNLLEGSCRSRGRHKLSRPEWKQIANQAVLSIFNLFINPCVFSQHPYSTFNPWNRRQLYRRITTQIEFCWHSSSFTPTSFLATPLLRCERSFRFNHWCGKTPERDWQAAAQSASQNQGRELRTPHLRPAWPPHPSGLPSRCEPLRGNSHHELYLCVKHKFPERI